MGAALNYLIYTCASSATTNLTRMLNISYQVEAWTPTMLKRVRVPRKKRYRLKYVPLMPSFIFVPKTAEEVVDGLVASYKVNIKKMQVNGAWAEVSLRDLYSIKEPDEKQELEQAVATLRVDDRVCVVSGPFTGDQGKVVTLKEGFVVVFSNKYQANIDFPPFMLRIDPI